MVWRQTQLTLIIRRLPVVGIAPPHRRRQRRRRRTSSCQNTAWSKCRKTISMTPLRRTTLLPCHQPYHYHQRRRCQWGKASVSNLLFLRLVTFHPFLHRRIFSTQVGAKWRGFCPAAEYLLWTNDWSNEWLIQCKTTEKERVVRVMKFYTLFRTNGWATH